MEGDVTASSGNPRAIFAIAETYDPNMLSVCRIRGSGATAGIKPHLNSLSTRPATDAAELGTSTPILC